LWAGTCVVPVPLVLLVASLEVMFLVLAGLLYVLAKKYHDYNCRFGCCCRFCALVLPFVASLEVTHSLLVGLLCVPEKKYHLNICGCVRSCRFYVLVLTPLSPLRRCRFPCWLSCSTCMRRSSTSTTVAVAAAAELAAWNRWLLNLLIRRSAALGHKWP